MLPLTRPRFRLFMRKGAPNRDWHLLGAEWNPSERREAMETYIMLTKLTDQGRKTIKEKPNRTQEVNKEVEAMGGKVLAQYAVLGPYDFVNVVQAPNNKTIAKISVELGSRGTMDIMTLPVVNL
jgi:uncharacterized protein with GYD domain